MGSRSAERRDPVTRGTRNVFADLGFTDAAERQARLRLTYALNQALQARKLSRADAAKVLGITQPKLLSLQHYKLADFSVEQLMNLLTALEWRYLLCESCEGRFNKFETEVCESIFLPIHERRQDRFRYGPYFGRFAVSVAWRAMVVLRRRRAPRPP